MATEIILYLSVFLATAVILSRWRFATPRPPLPPGPSKLPLVGNLHNAPVDNPFVRWHLWSREYGPIVSLNVLGQTIIILNDSETANDLLSKRATIYSGRPSSAMSALISKTQQEPIHVLLRQYGPTFRLHQRLLSACMNVTTQSRFQSLQTLEGKQLLHDLLMDICDGGSITSDRVFAHLERAQASLTMGVSYGYRILTPDDPVTQETVRIHGLLIELVAQPGLIDIFPILKRLPTWASPWKRAAKRLFELESALHQRNFAAGLAATGWNFSKQLRASSGAKGTDNFDLAYIVGANTVGGLETTSRALMWLFVAALTASGTSSFVVRAQAALDSIVGRSRLPEMRDRPRLPYLDAIVLELLRWRPVAPSGVPHRADQEDNYRGFQIPAGSVMIPNIWGIGREEKFGMSTEDFIPERWLKLQSTEANVAGSGDIWLSAAIQRNIPMPFFGYGRRMCTGRLMAEDGLWLAIAQLLWTFDIDNIAEHSRPNPNDIRPHGFTITPGPFEMNLKPRGPWVRDVVSQAWETAEKDMSTVLGEMPKTTD